MRVKRFALSVLALLVPLACGDDSDPAATSAQPDAATIDAGVDATVTTEDATVAVDSGSDASPQPPAGCVEDADSTDPASAPCVSDAFAVFVDALAGLDTSAGTKAQPKKTIASALTAAKDSNKKRVYICGAGPYPEVFAPDFGFQLRGGYACGSWSYNGGRARIAPALAGPAMKVDSVSDLLSLSDVEFVPLDIKGLGDGSSSIGIFAVKSKLRLKRVSVLALDGAKGKDGTTGTNGAYAATTPLLNSGNANGPFPAKCTCNGDGQTTQGGLGQNGPITSPPGVPRGLPIYASSPFGGNPGNGPVPGFVGGDAPTAKDASGNLKLGVLSATGWLATNPPDDAEGGKVGQGGGGGGCGSNATDCANGLAKGGGGGCGGCGGGRGTSGTAGGSSFALVSIDSTIDLIDCSLTSGAGGAGGKGGSGGTAMQGGILGAGINGAVSGGNGGRGAPGGAGAGAPGGLSVGILYKGAAPLSDAETTKRTVVGAVGPGGTGGAASNNGPSGRAEKVLDASTL